MSSFAEGWIVGTAIGLPLCFLMGYFASRSSRKRQLREFDRRMDELTQWPEDKE